MDLDEIQITRAIVDSYTQKFKESLDIDVAIAGAGPAGMTAAYYLAKDGHRVSIFEKKLSPGGGMWGGGMLFNQIVVQEEGKEVLDEFGITYSQYSPGYYVADSVEAASTICSKAIKAGAKIFNSVAVEDVIFKENRVSGLVINWTPVEMAGLHVDPLTIRCSYLIEATGHPLEILSVLEKKTGTKLYTETGSIMGERSMDATQGEQDCVEFTREVAPHVFVAGMAANAAFGRPRMGPIFGGMLLSGRRVASLISERLRGK